jgi:transcriptional regulator GlxA family with amidase domain
MDFVKNVRLKHVRKMLASPDEATTVTSVACSFSNLGHFAEDYSTRFGEKPSQNLKRSRGHLLGETS